MTLQQLADLLVEVNGGGRFVVKRFPAMRKKIDIGDFYADHGLITAKLGWRPWTSLRTALGRTVGYYRKELWHYV
ncbi:MAG: NAD(P)-dependent oxidoreductase [Opitutaceae bacterium]|nr:NAD(P)-dependent oxidoreductase [Opitutaceae bacterium]